MASKAMGIGKDAALTWFDNNVNEDKPLYSCWQGSNILFSYWGNDLQESRANLENNLDGLIANDYSDLLTLRTHRSSDGEKKYTFVTAKTPVISTFVFRPVDYKPSEYRRLDGTLITGIETSGNAQILEELRNINSRLDSLEDDEEIKPMGEISQAKPDLYSFLNSIIQIPAVQGILVNKLSGWLGVPNVAPVAATQIAGIPQNITMSQQEVDAAIEALNVLKEHRPQIVADLINLANIAQTDPKQAQFILSMLPK